MEANADFELTNDGQRTFATDLFSPFITHIVRGVCFEEYRGTRIRREWIRAHEEVAQFDEDGIPMEGVELIVRITYHVEINSN